MLRRWLEPTSYDAFQAARRARQAFAIPALSAIRPELFDLAQLVKTLRGVDTADALLVEEGQLREERVPSAEDELAGWLRAGVGVVVRRAEQRTPELLQLARCFEQEFAREVHIQLFVTPAQRQGFGWHYDAEDVIILQTGGSKQYYFRHNTLGTRVPPDFTQVRSESSPRMTCVLHVGDALFLPQGMWHAARAIDDSYSISLGVAVD